MIMNNGETKKLCEREWWNRSEKMKKNEEQLIEKEKRREKRESMHNKFCTK